MEAMVAEREDIAYEMPDFEGEFDCSRKYPDACYKAYMDAFESIILKVFKYRSDLPIECSDSEDVYTYIYACEQDSLDDFLRWITRQHLSTSSTCINIHL